MSIVKTEQINIKVTPTFKKQTKKMAKLTGLSVSTFLHVAIISYIDKIKAEKHHKQKELIK